MLTPELRTYLERLRNLPQAPTEADIQSALFERGWNEESIKDALNYFRTALGEASVPLPVPIPDGLSLSSEAVTDVDFGEEEKKEDKSQPLLSRLPSSGGTTDVGDGEKRFLPGHSSQSVLYPDNSSRLGLRGPEEEKNVEREEQPPTSQKREGLRPPMMDLAAAVSRVSTEKDIDLGKEEVVMSEKKLEEEKPLRTMPAMSLPRPIQGERPAPLPRAMSVAQKGIAGRMPSVDGVRRGVPITRPVPEMPRRVETIPRKEVSMPDVRVPRGSTAPLSRFEEQPTPSPVVTREIHARRSSRFVTRVGIIAILLGAVAAVGYAYVTGFGPFGKSGPYTRETFANDFLQGVLSLKGAVLTATYDLSYAPVDEKIKRFPVNFQDDETPINLFFPGLTLPVFSYPDGSVSLSGSLSFNKVAENLEYTGEVSGEYGGAGTSVKARVRFLRAEEKFFANISEADDPLFEAMIGNVSALSGEWIELFSDDIETNSISERVAMIEEKLGAGNAGAFLRALVFALDTEKVFSYRRSPEAVTTWKGEGTRYTLKVDFEKLGPVFRRLANDALTISGGTYAEMAGDFSKTAALLEDPAHAPLLAYLSKHASLAIDVSRDGVPAAITVSLMLLPENPDAEFADRKLEAKLFITFTDVTSPQNVMIPEGTIPFPEAVRLMMGLTLEEYDMSVQLQRVSALAQAIDTFKQSVGRLPATTDELLLTNEELGVGSREDSFETVRRLYNDRPYLPLVPEDVFTGEPFMYTPKEDGKYELVYTIELPSLRAEALDYYSEWAYDVSPGAESGALWQVLEGENTLTEDMFSVEGEVHR